MATTDTSAKAVDNFTVSRRSRIRYTNEQLKRLENIFSQTQYPDSKVQEQVAADFRVPIEKIHIWFQNRRSKFKRESKSSHVMWMRKQIFDTEDDKDLAFPFGTPRLPVLTSPCHVLSPPDMAQYGRQDAPWEKPTANLETQQSPPVEFTPILDLRVSPQSRTTSTPKSDSAHSLPRPLSTPASRDSHIPCNTFSDVSFSPCRYSSPSQMTTFPMMPKTYYPLAPAHTFPRNILSPVGFHGNHSDFYKHQDSASPSDTSNFHRNSSNITFKPYLPQWFPSAVPSPSTVSTSLPFTTKQKEYLSETRNGGSKRKRDVATCDEPLDPDIKRPKSSQNIYLEPDSQDTYTDSPGISEARGSTDIGLQLLSDACASAEKETGNSTKDRDYNSDSSTHVDLDQWC